MLAGIEKKLKVFCSKKEAALIHVGTFQSSLINTIHTILYIVYYVSIIPDRYGSVRIFIPDKPSVLSDQIFFGTIFITERGLNVPIFKAIRGASGSYRSAPKLYWKHI